MRIVVGLGNPGRRYARTRHNAGFMVVDRLAERWKVRLRDDPHVGGTGGTTRFGDLDVLLLKPQRYMNCSGEVLAALEMPCRAEDLVVVHDDMDLSVGRLRVRRNGGAGGHRGVESVATVCGKDFDRVRVGVGRPPSGVDPVEYVLSAPAGNEWDLFMETVAKAGLAVECLLTSGVTEAMNRFNARNPFGENRTDGKN